MDQTKTFDLRNQEGLTALGRLIMGLHKLVQHPHNQVCTLHSSAFQVQGLSRNFGSTGQNSWEYPLGFKGLFRILGGIDSS